MTAIETLGWALIHFVWQGAAIALLFAAADRALRDATARARYAAACGAMLLMLASAAGTFAWLYPGAAPARSQAAETASVAVAAPGLGALLEGGESAVTAAAGFSSYLPLLVSFWFAGVCVLGIRSLGGWVVVQRMRRRASRPASDVAEEQLARLARRLGVTRLVRLRESAAAQAPAVIGWLRPVVLLPATALSGLTPQQIEALLAHELAHIRRHDYLVNLLQTAVETLLFYHPAVWWVGRRIRAERENCCDDLAVEVCGDALAYARALARLEQCRQEMPQLAMASSHGSLLHRIQRLLAPSRATGGGSSRHAAWNGALSVLLFLLAVWAAQHVSLQNGFSQALQNPDQAPVVEQEVEVEAAPTVEPAPSADVAVEVNPVPAVAPEPSMDTAPEVRPAPAVDPAPSVDLAPAVRPAPAARPAPSPRPAADPRAAVPATGSGDGVGDGAGDGYGLGRGFGSDLGAGIREGIQDGIRQGVRGGVRSGVKRGVATGIREGVVTGIQEGIQDGVHVLVATTVGHAVQASVRSGIVHAAGLAYQAAPPPPPPAPAPQAEGESGGFIDGLAAAGYRDLSIDQLIKLKTHGVTPEYVRGMQAAGLKPSPDELAKLRIHGVTPEYIQELKAAGIEATIGRIVKFRIHGVNLSAVKEMTDLGYKLSPDQMVKMRIHGLTPELARNAKQLGFGDPTFEQLLKMQIHGVTPEFTASMKDTGMSNLSLEQLVKLRIHGAEPAQIREFVELGYKNLSANDVVKMRVHGVTPAFVREVQRHGFKDLDLDKIIKLKQLGIIDEPAFI